MNGGDDSSIYVTPLVVGVTGHRDLLDSEVPDIESQVQNLFDELQSRFAHTPVRLLSSLAEGADRLAANVALRSGVELQVALPMPAAMYRKDFSTDESEAEFDELCARADVMELPVRNGARSSDQLHGDSRNIAYADAGMFISAHCHILLAIWDGKESQNVGGTAQIVYFQHYDRLPGLAESVPRTSLFLTDDESDLVYHIPCSRLQSIPAGTEQALLGKPTWFTADPDNPNLTELPERYVRVFERTDGFNRDIVRNLEQQGLPTVSLAAPVSETIREAAAQIARVFGITDALADHFQRRISLTLRATYGLAVLAGLAFILYSEIGRLGFLIFAFLFFLLGGMAVVEIARRRGWHRKYLEYRVLAEGLRVQYYWAIAGIHDDGQSKFAYDNFLRQRDMELGWIRNIMRVAGTVGDSKPHSRDDDRLRFAIEQWIGDESNPGQLHYYKAKAAERARSNRFTDRLTLACLWGGILIACVLAFFLDVIGEASRVQLIVLMGILPLTAAVTEAYTQRKANRELTKQYEFMEHVFSNARRRIDEAQNVSEQREVLQGLGDAALTEHAEWILIHRDRQPDSTGY